MLTYSGRTPFSLKPLDLSRVVEETADLLEASVAKRIALEILPASERLPMAGDETQLRQVVINLVTNAAEAIGEANGRVCVRTSTRRVEAGSGLRAIGTPDPGPGSYVSLEVSDDGPGIDETAQLRIFEPFYTTRHSGRGLGLAAVLGIVQGHHGFISLESSPGAGTTFRVLFPRLAGPSRPEAPPKEPAPAAASLGRVLLVDDEAFVLEVGAEFLKRAGYEVETASGGREALALLEERGDAIDAVVLDLVMPELDGEETLRALRRLRPAVPVLLTSGYDEERTAERFDDADIAGFLRKPYEPEELIAKVGAAIAHATR
jgi:CheY-like chemotaxis protein